MSNKKPICYGSGLLALDILIRNNNNRDFKYYTGGSCGNIMLILAYMGWRTYPIARLYQDKYATRIIKDLIYNDVNIDYISIDRSGSTPVIIQKNIIDKSGNAKHKFEIIHPVTKEYLPRFKSITKKTAEHIINESSEAVPDFFYFDRISPGILMLADHLKKQGSLIVFEPTSSKNKDFEKALSLADIVKYSNQRINDYKEKYINSIAPIEIETQGEKGLLFRSVSLGNEWNRLAPDDIPQEKIIDASGAGDWTTAGIIYALNALNVTKLNTIKHEALLYALTFGQRLGAQNCLYEGARGLMNSPDKNVLKNSLLSFNNL